MEFSLSPILSLFVYLSPSIYVMIVALISTHDIQALHTTFLLTTNSALLLMTVYSKPHKEGGFLLITPCK